MKKGAWLQFNGELIGQGKDAAQKAMVEKPELSKKVVEAIMSKTKPERRRADAAP
jgi:recombination protein RecA